MGALCVKPCGDSGGGAELLDALRSTAARLAFDLVATPTPQGGLDVCGDRPLSPASRQSVATLVLSYLPHGRARYTCELTGETLHFRGPHELP
jgi:hypothetical protein